MFQVQYLKSTAKTPTEFYSKYSIGPFTKGQSTTIGNSLRRVLLSNLQGLAITGVRIKGIDHEFSTIKGVVQDVTEIILNLKQVRFKQQIDSIEDEKATLKVKGQNDGRCYYEENHSLPVAEMAPDDVAILSQVGFNDWYAKASDKDKKKILNKLIKKEIDIIFGTHALFQKKVEFKKLGLIIIDEQHKFGVSQRKKLSDKAGKDCDVLLMTATPIPRTLTMTIYGDMDLSIIREKPNNRKPVKTYSKIESKIEDVIKFIKKEIQLGNQIFWVCPLIEESKKIDHSSAIKKSEYLKKIFPNEVYLLHGKTTIEEKEEILNKFLRNEFKILVSTTIIEVGIDFPNANVIIIENANKFGLSQLHQLRGRVGRGNKESSCVLMFKSNLSENAKKRINILKDSNDGFKISEEDMKLRGFGDILGFKQSGIKNFKLADPIHNHNLFILAEKEIKRIENEKEDIGRFKPLIKLYDRADIINDIA